jgi:hypothetical protein
MTSPSVDIEGIRKMWECPGCAFAFDAMHTNEDGSYSCPACAEIRLAEEVTRLRKELDDANADLEHVAVADWDDLGSICRRLSSAPEGDVSVLRRAIRIQREDDELADPSCLRQGKP